MKFHMNKAPIGWDGYDYYDMTVNEARIRESDDIEAVMG